MAPGRTGYAFLSGLSGGTHAAGHRGIVSSQQRVPQKKPSGSWTASQEGSGAGEHRQARATSRGCAWAAGSFMGIVVGSQRLSLPTRRGTLAYGCTSAMSRVS